LIKYRAVAVCALFLSSSCFSEEEIKRIDLLMDVDSNWPTEYCVDVREGIMHYEFEAPHPTKFGTHIHNKQGTKDQISNRILSQFKNKVEIGALGGNFCFTWQKTKSYQKDWVISLQYEVLAAPNMP